MKKVPNNLKPENVIVTVDSREQRPLSLSPLRTEVGTLSTGDYALKSMPTLACIERKGLEDVIACIGRERERFEKELQRMLAYPVRALVIEANWSQIELKQYRGQVHPNAVLGSFMGWIAMGIPVIMIGDHERAGKWVSRMLYLAANRRYRENLPLHENNLESQV